MVGIGGRFCQSVEYKDLHLVLGRYREQDAADLIGIGRALLRNPVVLEE